MGNYRFRLSEMIPNAWFYKLKDLSTTTKNHKIHPKKKSLPPPPPPPTSPQHWQKMEGQQQQQQRQTHITHSRKSYYITRKQTDQVDPETPEKFAPDPPRKSSRKRPPTKRKSENRAPCSASSDYRLDPPLLAPDDVFIEVDFKIHDQKREISKGLESISRIELASIITRPEHSTQNRGNAIDRITKEPQKGSSTRRVSVSSPANGVKLRVNSPRIMGSNGSGGGGRRSSFSSSGRRQSLSESFAIVKASSDPQRDFKESMLEMIMENDIKGSKELEELLACYLSLNSDEYHHVIINVFKQIWFHVNNGPIVFK